MDFWCVATILSMNEGEKMYPKEYLVLVPLFAVKKHVFLVVSNGSLADESHPITPPSLPLAGFPTPPLPR